MSNTVGPSHEHRTSMLTVADATVAEDRVAELVEGFRAMVGEGLPEGLLRTELLRGRDGRWRVQSLWRERADLDALRSSGKPPAALELFRSVGSEHTHDVFFVEVTAG